MFKAYLLYFVCFVLILATDRFVELSLINASMQFFIFLGIAATPAVSTQRMSYVDIAWPVGLFALGLICYLNAGSWEIRGQCIALIYMAIGGRMALGAIWLWNKGAFNQEFPRYLYLRAHWPQHPGVNQNWMLLKEIFLQAAANTTFLALPITLQVYNLSPELSPLEIFGYGMWFVAFSLETLADLQKRRFTRRHRKSRTLVCNVGLWRYSRHPNYFAEWMVWNSLIISSIPSVLYFAKTQSIPLAILLGMALLYVSRLMYICLVYYTGAKPAEYFSLQKRPGYLAYMGRTNMFFPWFHKVGDS